MKYEVYCDELYPYYGYVHCINQPQRNTIEIDNDTIARWDVIMTQFCEMQDELKELYNKSNDKTPV